jgi:AcrR family transcriptional regulator
LPRNKTVSDEAILQAAATTMSKLGPKDFSLRAVGDRIGLSAATLLQRFGSKRGLLLACVSQGAAVVEQQFDALLRQEGRILDTLIEHLACSAEALTNSTQQPENTRLRFAAVLGNYCGARSPPMKYPNATSRHSHAESKLFGMERSSSGP